MFKPSRAALRAARRVTETTLRTHEPLLAYRIPRQLELADAEWADLVVTMGCGDACQVILGKRYLDWELEDPAGKGLPEVLAIRDRRLAGFVSELGQAVRSGSGGVVETSGVIARLSTPDRFLPLWIALAMAGDLVLVRFRQDSALR